ncbi:MAG: MMPL family transporter [Paludibacteraceae bacterium]|nr:MMPL family transporter [Paludibacteraceae bacterium]
MKRLFYFFRQHKPILLAVIGFCVVVVAWFSAQCEFGENIFQLLPETGNEEYRVTFTNLKLKDKIFVQAVKTDSNSNVSQDQLAEALDMFIDSVVNVTDERQSVEHTLSYIDPLMLINIADYAASHLPAYMDFTPKQMDSLCSVGHICNQLNLYQEFLDTELGQNFYDIVAYDPCGLVYDKLSAIIPSDEIDSKTTNKGGLINNHLYTADGDVCFGFITPSFGTDNSRESSRLNRTMDKIRNQVREQYPGVDILYHGTTVLSGGNSQRMHTDIYVTVSVAMLIILVLLSLCLKRPSYIVLTVCALGFGVLMALAVLFAWQGGMSVMSLGIGAIVLGVAFSYVLHILIHYIYTGSVDLTLEEQTKPVLLGSLTTIGAFAGLLFTQSQLLKDFGFFALLVIIGTTLFSLIVIPHFLPRKYAPNKKAFQLLEKANAYHIERNKSICTLTLIWVIVCICFSGRYTFDSDLTHIGYTSADCQRAQDSWAEHMNQGYNKLYFASVAPSVEEALEQLPAIESSLDSLNAQGLIINGLHTSMLLPSLQKQKERLAMWSNYFTPSKQIEVWHNIQKACAQTGIEADMFLPFREMMEHPAEPELLTDSSVLPPEITENLMEQTGDHVLVYFPVKTSYENSHKVTDCLASKKGCMVMDPYYYTTGLVELIHDDFNLIMWISSIFVFLLLFVTYRNLWLTIIALCPMVLSWYTVLGAMAIFGQSFNLVNIIVSSFVFGIGVDYSIFILEGLLRGNEDNATMVYNKTAITLSATILVICMFILGFAKHPAIQSISFASVVGMVTTILLSYTLEPNLFKLYQYIKTKKNK